MNQNLKQFLEGKTASKIFNEITTLFFIHPGGHPQDKTFHVTGTTDAEKLVGELERSAPPFQASRFPYKGERFLPGAIQIHLEAIGAEYVNCFAMSYYKYPSEKDVDLIIYHSKTSGRERFAIFDPRSQRYYVIRDKNDCVKNVHMVLKKGSFINAASYRV